MRCLWSIRGLGSLALPVHLCLQGIYDSLASVMLENSSWTLKPETSLSSTSPDTHTPPCVWYNLRQRRTHAALGWVGGRNCNPAYWADRRAGHSGHSRLLLWQTSTVIHVCKVKRYFDIRWSPWALAFIFIKTVYTCCSVNNWARMFLRGVRGGYHFLPPCTPHTPWCQQGSHMSQTGRQF